jgi:hypothetical protein
MTVVALKITRTPYTYILEWTKLGKKYIGVRWGIGCDPKDLWTTYFTSSHFVKEFAAKNGAPDIITIDQIFTEPQKALEREKILLRKFDAVRNSEFLNKNIGGVWDHNDPDIRRRQSQSHMGLRNALGWKPSDLTRARMSIAQSNRSPDSRARIGDALRGRKQDQAFAFRRTRGRIGKRHTAEAKAKIGAASRGRFFSKEAREKMSIARREYWQNQRSGEMVT